MESGPIVAALCPLHRFVLNWNDKHTIQECDAWSHLETPCLPLAPPPPCPCLPSTAPTRISRRPECACSLPVGPLTRTTDTQYEYAYVQSAQGLPQDVLTGSRLDENQASVRIPALAASALPLSVPACGFKRYQRLQQPPCVHDPSRYPALNVRTGLPRRNGTPISPSHRGIQPAPAPPAD